MSTTPQDEPAPQSIPLPKVANTPPGVMNHSRYSTNAHFQERKEQHADVEVQLRDEIGRSVYCDTPQFIEKIFEGVEDSVVKKIFNVACTGSNPLYSRDRWTKFPDPTPGSEKQLYNPFVDTANFITQECGTASATVPNDNRNIWWSTASTAIPKARGCIYWP
ncbi:uncharacterized protein FIBRA_05433 [Fibroporia radiculosa]|uniref:Uncharacterized protein n=1 Tax=Fibroporia radiculosa TaxID=599839 RepID=J4GR00_9APHY|nr:uncharacterized protein FIBRA_05433 [Fibroporia radiculosa]CCM03305.1 predicted protein [Fibroporia radiculosa]